MEGPRSLAGIQSPYSVLPGEAPGAPGPQVRSAVAPALGLVLRVLNTVFGALALALLFYSLYLDWQYTHGGSNNSGSSGGSSVRAGEDLALTAAGAAAASLVPSAAVQRLWGSLGTASSLAALKLHGEAGVSSFPWFIYALGGTAAYVLGMALLGYTGVKQSSRWRVGAYIAMLSGLILAEALVLLLLFTNNDWRQRLPGDPSGCWEAALKYLDKNSQLAKVACLAVMGAQLVALGAASWLHSLQQAAYEAWVDDREEAEARARAALQQSVQRQYQEGSGSLWAQRMRQKYGVTNSQVVRDAAALRQVAALSGDAPGISLA